MFSKFDSEKKAWNGPSVQYPFSMDFMLGDLIDQNLTKEPKKILQISEIDGVKITGEDLRINSIRISQNLTKIGIVADDVICLFLKPSNLTTFIVNGCIFIGAILNSLDASLDNADIQHIIHQTKPKIIICEDNDIPKIANILIKLKHEIPIYSTSSQNPEYPSSLEFLRPTNKENEFKVSKFSKRSDEKILAIICTSGTTGRPNGVSISHAGCLAWRGLMHDSKRVSLCFSSPYWSSGFFRNITPVLLNDVHIVTSKEFSVDNFIDICKKFDVTNVSMPPYQLALLLNSEKFQSTNIESLTTFLIIGSILSKNLRTKFEKIFPNKNLFIAYGMTETIGIMSMPMEYKKEFCVGSMITSNISIKIINDDGMSLENGEKGEICIKPYRTFLGYYNNPEATAEAFDDDGFIKTGDVGYFDENGLLYVIDRKKDIVKYKGYHVNPSDIENILETLEGIQYASVVGIPDELYTTTLAAAIVKLKGYEDLKEERIIKYVASKLPEYKHLHGGVYFFNELPMTLSGKVKKQLVLEAIQRLKFNKKEGMIRKK